MPQKHPGRRVLPLNMNVNGTAYRSLWPATGQRAVWIIDQTALPHAFETCLLTSLDDAAAAIRVMRVRGAPLIGATAAYGMALAMSADASYPNICAAYELLLKTRPTAVNLRWALDRMVAVLSALSSPARETRAWEEAARICDEDVELNAAIGRHGLTLISAAYERTQAPVEILTHCNAGWLATVDWGTALAPVYAAHDAGIPVHVWVSETRPRNQGAALTAWELKQHGVPHTLIVDNAAGHLMQKRQVDLVLVGTDRTTATGDVCNKIGTYLKALAAKDNNIPFYVAAPGPSIDWKLRDGLREIPIEQRAAEEVTQMTGRTENGALAAVRIAPEHTPAMNFGFDVTPAHLVTALITERGCSPASASALQRLYPEHAS